MTISDFKYFPFSLKLIKPFQTSLQTITERKGYIISITDELGNASFGECSPLIGFSVETLEDVERILLGLQYQLIGFSAEENFTSVTELLADFTLVPSLHFALEQVFLSAIIKRNVNFLKNNFPDIKSEIEVNAVIDFDTEENTLNRITEKLKKGYATFKIKVGRDNFEKDFELIQNVRSAFGNMIKIRLDANRKWSSENAAVYLERLSPFGIEYIEEPCKNMENSLELARYSIIPIALDELLKSKEDAYKVINDSKINFIILKPMIYGGILSSLQIIKEAEKKNKCVIISSLFESAVGKSVLALLAASVKHSLAHGLDTSENFEHDICYDQCQVRNGRMYFEENNFSQLFNIAFP